MGERKKSVVFLVGLLLLASLALWVGANRPWVNRARPSEGIDLPAAPAAVATLMLAAPSAPAFPVAAPATSPATFTSREVITTTWAVPLHDWQGGVARRVALSADGRWVAFTAAPPGTETAQSYDDLYVYDRDRGALTLVSQAPDGSTQQWLDRRAQHDARRWLDCVLFVGRQFAPRR